MARKKTIKKKEIRKSKIVLAKGEELKISPSKPPRLKVKYEQEILPKLQKEFGFKNKNEVPKLKSIIVHCAVKEAVSQPKVLDAAADDLMWMTGQKSMITRAKKSVASFKVRQGMPLAVKVTLRRARMYEFLDHLIHIALPRVRDFKGVSAKAFDGRGNYNIGIREQIVFPEIQYDQVDQIRGFTVTVVTTAKNNEHARSLLGALGMPFRK